MAPDLNGIFKGGKWDYSTPGSWGYDLPDITFNDPSTRPVKILGVGAGFSNIMMAYKIQKECQNVDLKIFDKNHDIGGTWLENRYPGCGCDIPSHAYTMAFALNPDWPRFFSYAPDIWEYLNKICEVFGLRKYMSFSSKVVHAEWQDKKGHWKVKIEQQKEGSDQVKTIEEECDVLLYGTGILNKQKWPKGLDLSKFKGRVAHTATWPKDYQQEAWKNERVAVLGSGASSIQTVPTMQPHVKHMDIFVRTGVWFVQIANNFGQNKVYSDEEKEKFRSDPKSMLAHAKDIENQINGLNQLIYHGSEAQQMARKLFSERMKEHIKDERLLKGFTPTWDVACRRVTPGDPYMQAIQQPNVDVHFTHVTDVTADGVIGADGEERKVDTIICATGFDVSYKPRFPVIGKNGINLQDKWGESPEGYLGLGAPDMPNFIIFIGPTWPVENGSVAGPLKAVGEYTIKLIKKLQRDHIKSMTPSQSKTDAFNLHAQEWIKYTVWKDDCRSWYKDNDTGRVNAVWPGSSLHYMATLEHPRWEDWDIEYMDGNPFAAFGKGRTWRDETQGADLSPYLTKHGVDGKWMNAVGSSREKMVEGEMTVTEDEEIANAKANAAKAEVGSTFAHT